MKVIHNDGTVAECPEEEELHVIRHSAAHIMAQAIKRLHPNADFAYGPATETGFYYDVDLGEEKLSDEDLAAIEVAGKNAAGQVDVVVSGDFNVKKVYISPSLAEMKDAAILESAVFEAMNNALVQAKMESAKKLSEATGGINIPGITG